jgi:serine/threonine protein kinase
VALVSGTVLADRYCIVRPIQSGGMGSVYEAVDQRLADTPCAVKEMLEQFLDSEGQDFALRRFGEEMRYLATLSHPGIPRVRDFFEQQGVDSSRIQYVGRGKSILLDSSDPYNSVNRRVRIVATH